LPRHDQRPTGRVSLRPANAFASWPNTTAVKAVPEARASSAAGSVSPQRHPPTTGTLRNAGPVRAGPALLERSGAQPFRTSILVGAALARSGTGIRISRIPSR
jgi:hypothetical protein